MRKGSAREALEASVPAARRCHDRVREEPAGLRERVPSTRNPAEDEERIPAMPVSRDSRDRLHEGACIVAPTESVRCLREKEAALRRWRETLEHPSELPDRGRIEEGREEVVARVARPAAHGEPLSDEAVKLGGGDAEEGGPRRRLSKDGERSGGPLEIRVEAIQDRVLEEALRLPPPPPPPPRPPGGGVRGGGAAGRAGGRDSGSRFAPRHPHAPQGDGRTRPARRPREGPRGSAGAARDVPARRARPAAPARSRGSSRHRRSR